MAAAIMNCDLHDYLEIACLFAYRVRITLKNGDALTGTPVTTLTEARQREYLLFHSRSGGETRKIPLEALSTMTVLNPKARFRRVDFQCRHLLG